MTSVEISTMRLLAHLFKSSQLWGLLQLIFSLVVLMATNSIISLLIICLLLAILLYYQLRLQLDAAILLDLSSAMINPQDLDQALYELNLINQTKNNRTIAERCDACYSLWKKYLFVSALHLIVNLWFLVQYISV